MEIKRILKITKGLDVLSEETSLPTGAVRRADEIIIDRSGAWGRRKGFALAAVAPAVHSLHGCAQRTLTVAARGAYLSQLTGPSWAWTNLFLGLAPGVPVGYSELEGSLWFTQPGVVARVLPDLSVRKPGVGSLFTTKPTLINLPNGALAAARYGVAYSVVNDLGEESGLSDVEYLACPGGGIMAAGLQYGFGYVSSIRLYMTPPNGDQLYLAGEFTPAASVSIVSQQLTKPARNQYLDVLPGGRLLCHYRGRTYVADGRFVYASDSFNPGLYDTRQSAMVFEDPVSVLEPGLSGIFVGQGERVLWLDGTGPGDFKPRPVSPHGAFMGSGTRVPSSMFDPKVVSADFKEVVVWLSEVGFVVGLPDGNTVPLQADRIALTGEGEAATLVFTRGGIKQAVSVVKSMGLNGSADAADTTLS